MKVITLALPAAACLIGLAAGGAAAQAPGAPGPGRGGRPGFRMPMPLMQALDADGDGELSAQEIENATAALKTLDKDRNGKVSSDELRPAAAGRGAAALPTPSPQEVVSQLMALDKNGDGKLAKDELPDRMQVLMDRADYNKDGVLDKAELTAYALQASRRGQGPATGRDGSGPPRSVGDGNAQPPRRDRSPSSAGRADA
jgi:hypothetical protein